MQEVIAFGRPAVSPFRQWLLAIVISGVTCVLQSGCHADRENQWESVLDISPDFRLTKLVVDDDAAVTFPKGRGVQLVPRKAGNWTTFALLLSPTRNDGQQRKVSVVCKLLSQQSGGKAEINIQQIRRKTVGEKYYPLLPSGNGKRMEDGGVVGNESNEPVAIGSSLSSVELRTELHSESEQVQVFLRVQTAHDASAVSIRSISVKLEKIKEEKGRKAAMWE